MSQKIKGKTKGFPDNFCHECVIQFDDKAAYTRHQRRRHVE